MLYVERRPRVVNPTTLSITGRSLAHAHRSKGQRALIGIDLISGELSLVRPTATQVAGLVGVSLFYLHLASKIADDFDKRQEVMEGCPLYRAADGLADRLLRATAAERLAAAHELGPDTIWDDMVSPLVS